MFFDCQLFFCSSGPALMLALRIVWSMDSIGQFRSGESGDCRREVTSAESEPFSSLSGQCCLFVSWYASTTVCALGSGTERLCEASLNLSGLVAGDILLCTKR